MPTRIALPATDPDGDPLTLAVVDGPQWGTLGPVDGDHVTYTSATSFHGADRFTFRASDGALTSGTGTVHVQVTPVNHALVAAPLLAWDRVVTAPGEIVTLALRSTPAVTDLAGLGLMVDLTGTPGALPLMPTFALGAGTADGALAWDPRQPWHVASVRAAGITGAAELLRLTAPIPAAAPPGTAYVLGTRSAVTTDSAGGQTDVTGRVAPGRILIPPLPGDLDGDGAVTTADVPLMFRFVLDMNRPDERQLRAGDVRPRPGTGGRPCGDGEIRLNDMIWVLRRAVGLEIAP